MRRRPNIGAGLVTLLVVLTMLPGSVALADEGLRRTEFPSADDPGIPAYARIDANVPGAPPIFSDGEWAAIVFYRDPHCVPTGFNLLEFFDFNAFACPLTVTGFDLWEEEPLAAPPKLAKSSGTAVPVWLVPSSSILPALGDGVLTIGELANLNGLVVGEADRFSETLQPHPTPGVGGGHPVPKLILNAAGMVEGGGSFSVHISMLYPDLQSISIKVE